MSVSCLDFVAASGHWDTSRCAAAVGPACADACAQDAAAPTWVRATGDAGSACVVFAEDMRACGGPAVSDAHYTAPA